MTADTADTAVRAPPPRGSMRVARAFGIDVYLHWSWLAVAALMIPARSDAYSGLIWNVTEYIALFGIVLLHEFGHALACRGVQGRVRHILLWPLGGVAYVRAPERPGPMLWVAAAGPLVNVILVPLTLIAAIGVGVAAPETDVADLMSSIVAINVIVLVFNVLPVYPLDGGQMLRAVLWYFVGPHRSLAAAAVVGLLGAGGFLLIAFTISDWFLVAIAAFSLLSSWGGFVAARARLRAADQPRQATHACPWCGESPPVGEHWNCPGCTKAYDVFTTGAQCPHCQSLPDSVHCVFCADAHAVGAFRRAAPAAEGAAPVHAAGAAGEAAGAPGEQAVLVSFRYGLESNDALYALLDELEREVRASGLGEFDGHERAADGSDASLYLYGPDADALFAAIRGTLEATDFMRGARVVLRYGPAIDGVAETELVIGS